MVVTKPLVVNFLKKFGIAVDEEEVVIERSGPVKLVDRLTSLLF